MRLWSRRSPTFRFRAILIAFIPCAVVSTLATGIFAHYQADDIQDRYLLTYNAEAQRLADRSAAPLLGGKREVLNAMCEEAATHREIGLVVILDEFGRTVASARSRIDIDSTQRFQAEISKLHVDSNGLIHSEAIGLAVIEASTKSIEKSEAELFKLCLVFLAVSNGLGLLLAFFISQNLTRPFKRITETVSRISDGDLNSRVQISGDESIRGLAEGINLMATRIQNAQNNLRSQIDFATEAIRQERDQARDTTLAKSRFVVAATHDLRQPMQALKLLSVELDRRPLADSEAAIVKQMINSLSVVDQLIESFLDMSRLDVGAVQKNTSQFRADWLFERLKPDFYRIASSKGIEIRFAPSNHIVKTDPILFERVIRNIISNAIRYTKSSILIGTRIVGDSVGFEIRDDGNGISPDDCQRIFSDFVQLNNPERNQQKGLGMGLAIVKRLSKLLDLNVSVKSQLGSGTTFRVVVPRGYEPETIETDQTTSTGEIRDFSKIALVSKTMGDFSACLETLNDLGCDATHFSTLNPSLRESVIQHAPVFVLVHEDDLCRESHAWCLLDFIASTPCDTSWAAPLGVIVSGERVSLDDLGLSFDSIFYIGPSLRASKVRSIIQRRRVH